MTSWLNHVTIAAPRNGTATHTVNPNAGVVVAGASFIPTAGRRLVVVVGGAVTSTTPTGWTLPTGGSAINQTGLYVWHRLAAGGDTFTTTHNASNYPVVFDIYEFPADATFQKSVAQPAVIEGNDGPNLTGLTGSNNTIIGARVSPSPSPTGSGTLTAAWSGTNVGAELVDAQIIYAANDGYHYTAAALQDSNISSAQWIVTVTGSGHVPQNAEFLMFAITVPVSTPPTVTYYEWDGSVENEVTLDGEWNGTSIIPCVFDTVQ